jgi:hypothetical protein
MLVPKQMIVEQLRGRGDLEAAERADREFGEKVNTEDDAALLAELDIDVTQLEDDFGGQSPAVG